MRLDVQRTMTFVTFLVVFLAEASNAKTGGRLTQRKSLFSKTSSTSSKRGRTQNAYGELTPTDIQKCPDEQKLLKRLMAGYERASRPAFNTTHVVVVLFGITLTQIMNMDEVNQVLTTNVWLEQQWVDERLVWDPADYNGLKVMRIPCQRIWLPDIVLYNSADDFTQGFMQSRAMVNYTGEVFWPPPAKLRSSCKIDITYFPFDDQSCKMKFGSWTYDGYQVDMRNKSSEVDLENYVFSGEWKLMRILVERHEVRYPCCDEPYPDVTFTIIMRRRTLYYLFNVIFPCLWLSVLSLLGFWLPPDSGEKVTLGITVLLAFSVFMLLIAESMPATSEFVPLIGIYLTVTMGMTSLSIILTVFVLQLHHVGPNQRPVPKWIRTVVIDVIARVLCMQRRHTNIDDDDMRGGYYSYRDDINRTDDVCLTSFMDGVDFRDGSGGGGGGGGGGGHVSHHCNGRADRHLISKLERELLDRDRERGCYELSKHLTDLAHEHDDMDYEDMISEWRHVAHIMDRFLFWLFLAGTTISSISILVLKPMSKPDL